MYIKNADWSNSLLLRRFTFLLKQTQTDVLCLLREYFFLDLLFAALNKVAS